MTFGEIGYWISTVLVALLLLAISYLRRPASRRVAASTTNP